MAPSTRYVNITISCFVAAVTDELPKASETFAMPFLKLFVNE